MLHLILMLNTAKILMKPNLSSKLMIMLGFRNTKTFLQRYKRKIGWKKFLLLGKLRIIPWTYVISDLNVGLITGSFYEKELQKTS